MEDKNQELINNFNKLYYGNGGRTWSGGTKWLGCNVLKCTMDLWIYQEIIFENKPDIIIESGTGEGGSALYFASICDMINHEIVVSIDPENTNHKESLRKHNRITYLTGHSNSDEIFNQVKDIISNYPNPNNDKIQVMMTLDSDHHKEYVLHELELYSQLVTENQYLIVEDTNLSGHPNFTDYEGPWEAVHEFITKTNEFVIDESKNKHYLTFNPDGYLKKIKPKIDTKVETQTTEQTTEPSTSETNAIDTIDTTNTPQ